MKLGRYDRYLGHMPYRLPILFACAECGGGIRVCCTLDGGYSVVCMEDEKHDGLKSSALVEQEKALQVVSDNAEKFEQLIQLAQVSTTVNAFLEKKRAEDKKALFGEG